MVSYTLVTHEIPCLILILQLQKGILLYAALRSIIRINSIGNFDAVFSNKNIFRK